MKNISDLVLENIKPLFKGDITLVDVEYTKKADGMHLTIYIDKADGVTVDDCVEVSRLVDQPLEDLNPTNDEPYFLDISSYGLDKPLKFDWQFKKYIDNGDDFYEDHYAETLDLLEDKQFDDEIKDYYSEMYENEEDDII